MAQASAVGLEEGLDRISESAVPFADRRIWLVGGGDRQRDFSAMLMDSDVIAIGPAEPGPYRAPYTHKGRALHHVRRFHDTIREGDLAVLRVGVGSLRGVGVVESGYDYNTAFSDVDGWNIAHIRRCRWLWNEGHEWKGPGLGAQGASLVETHQKKIRDWVRRLSVHNKEFTRDLATIPPEGGEQLSFDDLGDYLFKQGLGLEYIEDLLSNLARIRRLTGWFQGEEISEHETTAYVVVPILLSLGWTQQIMAIEWNSADVALFSQLPREEENVAAVIEVKKVGHSLREAVGQAKGYVKKKGFVNCEQIVATDGRRWEVHRREGGEWNWLAYFNVKTPRDEYPLLGCQGALAGLKALMRFP